MVEDIAKIKAETQTVKNILEHRQNVVPPMCQKITMSVTSLMKHYDRILYLCELVEKLEGTIDNIQEEM